METIMKNIKGKTFEFCEILKTNHETKELIETASWIDITEKDLVP